MRLVPQGYSRDELLGSNEPRKVLILGSTGSIGTSTLEILRKFPNQFELFGLVAGRDSKAMAKQVEEFRPRYAALQERSECHRLSKMLADSGGLETEVLEGTVGILELAAHPEVDIVVCGIVGVAALPSVIAAVSAGKQVALANKECLVAGGKWVSEALRESPGASIIPVDSEHSALFQALQGENYRDVENLILTASGGPFLNSSLEELVAVRPQDAIAHPKWSMGKKISVDSATLMNKALEVIEAHWLYDLPDSKIEVLVHPQSIVHSLVRFVDGSELAQLSVPDMKGAIAYAMNYPHGRLPGVMNKLRLAEVGRLEFRELDEHRFPAVRLAKETIRVGGLKPFLFNLSNEIAVSMFLKGRLAFLDICRFVESSLSRHDPQEVMSSDDMHETEFYFRKVLEEDLTQFAARLHM